MMERQNGNMSPCKATENGIKGKPPYSVETPYGFRLDLDFLKYVDDIEKGNTIKRVPIQRRTKGPRASTLPRHLNSSGGGYRPSPWGSTGALGPRSRLTDGHYGCSSWAYEHRSQLSPTGLQSLAEMEARIREFDEQPLGEHIRPHLLRATSLPLTVLLRQGSESADEAGSLRGSMDRLGGGMTSCEDVFLSAESPRGPETSGLLRRLTEALERVGELEMEVRVVPELRAQICILQEERERLRLGLDFQTHSVNGTADPRSSSHYSTVDSKRPRHESHRAFPGGHDPSHEWRASTDLDELLTVTSLQAKVAVLEQKLHETGLELQRVSGLLREQQRESRSKDEKIEQLIKNPGEWVLAERVAVEQDADEAVTAPRSGTPDVFGTTNGRAVGSTDASDGTDTTVVVHHIDKIKGLLEQQWECLLAGCETVGEGKTRKHPNPKVNSLQQEMIGLVDILSSYYTQPIHGESIQHRVCQSIKATDGYPRTSSARHPGSANEGRKTSGNLPGKGCVKQSVHASIGSGEMAGVQVEAGPERGATGGEVHTSPDRQMTSRGAGSGRTDGGAAPASAGALEKPAETKPPGEQMEDNAGSEPNTKGREVVNAEFLGACQFLKDHMDNMENPNDDMRKALVVLFQNWFGAAAEEAAEASRVAEHLREVKRAAPGLLAFLINLADDNGNTVLHYSVSHCNHSIVGLLLDTGVSDVNLQNKAGYTAVMLASLTAPDGPAGMEVVRKLMELGNINIRSSQTGQTALHLAVRHGRVVMVRLLLSCGADANIQDGQGTTALMFAAERGYTHIARLLLERSQCDLGVTDKRGRTALSIATQGSHSDTAALLQAHAKARAL